MAVKSKKQTSGFSLVELIVAVAVFGILASGVTYVVINSYRNFFGGGDRQTVVQFAQEGMEATKSIRDNSWQAFVAVSGAGNQGVIKNSSGLWEFSGTSNTLGILTRVISVTSVHRDTSYNIVNSGGTDDPNTKKVTVTVSGFGISNFVLTSYLSNWSVHSWRQSDWSSTNSRSFWSNANSVSNAFSNVNTSTANQLTLSMEAGNEMSWSNWADLNPDLNANYIAWRDAFDLRFSPDNKSMYVLGTTNYQFIKYDITKASSGILSIQLKKNLPWHMSQMAMNPNGNYAYLGKWSYSDGVGIICVADLSSAVAVASGNCVNVTNANASNKIMDMVVSSDGAWLYAFDYFGYAYAFSITNGGATLTLVNDHQLVTSVSGAVITRVYLDESGASPYLFITSSDSNGRIRKMGIKDGDYFSSTSTNAYVNTSFSSTVDSIQYLETASGKKRYVLATQNTSLEFAIVEDQGTSLTTIGSLNLSVNGNSPIITTDGANMAFIQYYNPGGLYAIDITDRAHPADAGLVYNFDRRPTNLPCSGLVYSTVAHGLFLMAHHADNTTDLYFVNKPITRATGGTFNYRRKITLGLNSTVSGGPHTNFPVVISETQDYLKSVANGGKVQNSSGYDIIFASDVDGNTLLDHEIEYYDPATGELTAWVRIPSLNTNTEIYIFYGNSNITASQENPPGVWSNSYQIVNHLVDDTPTGTLNSIYSSNAGFKQGANSPAQSAGKIGRGESFDGDKLTTPYDWVQIDNSLNKIQGTGDFTVEFWMKPSSTYTITNSAPIYFGCGDLNKQDGWIFAFYPSTTRKLLFYMGDNNTTNLGYVYSSALTFDTWTHVSMVVDRDVGYQFYLNAATDTSCTAAPCNNTTAYSIGEVYNGYLGKWWSDTDYFYKGELDEFRVSTATRSQGWITTEYNNMNSPATFYSIGSEEGANGFKTPGYLYSSIYDLGSSDSEPESITVNQNIPSGCTVVMSVETANNSDFSDAVSVDISTSDTSVFTASLPVSLRNKRYLRYKATLNACNNNSQAPKLYSVQLNYR